MRRIIIILLFTFNFFPEIAAAQTTRINNGTNQTINQHGLCRQVANNCGGDIMVPHNTSAEWSGFVNSGPACATRTACTLSNFSVVGTTNGNGTTVSMPSGWQSGDLIVIYTFIDGQLVVYTATNTTELAERTSDGSTIRTFAKILDGSEGGGIGGLPSGTQWIALVLRPNGPLTSFTVHGVSNTWNWQFQSNTLQSGSAPKKPALAIASFGAPFNVVSMRSISPNTMTAISGANVTHEAHYFIFDSAATLANFALTLNDGGSRQKTQSLTLVFN